MPVPRVRITRCFLQTVCFVSLMVFGVPRNADANPALREPLRKAAGVISQILQREQMDSVAVGAFLGPPSFGTSAGAGFKKILTEELEEVDVRVRRIGAPMAVQGRYSLSSGRQLRIRMSLVNPQGDVLTNLSGRMTLQGPNGSEDVSVEDGQFNIDELTEADVLAELFGSTIDFQNRDDDDDVLGNGFPDGDDVLGSLTNPTAFIDQAGFVRASRTSPFGLRVIVDGRLARPVLEDGVPFVEIRRGEKFELEVDNRESFEAAVRIHLDGVNSFTFSEIRHLSGPQAGEPRYSRWIVKPRNRFRLKGWHVTNSDVREFLVTDFASSAAARVGSTTDLGMITASFRATWQQGQRPPSGEPVPKQVPTIARAPSFDAPAPESPASGVGIGERARQRVEEDGLKRDYGVPRAVITIRYTR
ncbi:hypothetical protein [Maioricimonas sp. JC845]|uniref:hypothetical protein n=1 Tax=Maioricimonas sp. JC845 TaxID=3232138 RepID=UPI00345903B0